ncbi:DMT family transporter [Rhodovastum atsumiense]|uniref:DMT family transporter n=1 Tax=Rhodovastum atsumiense TaxID=504468 RepID=A0A5M6IXK7_9PROT|nr:DMT family transporter [Rhodovastum atsumiense]KAA5612699.1 DMT family transporter [Rhodovastum atsumiense]
MTQTTQAPPRNLAAVAATGVAFSAIWSSAFVAGKFGLPYMDPLALLTVRFLMTGAILAALQWLLDRPFAMPGLLVRKALVLGLLNNAVYLGLSFEALQYMSPGLVVIVISSGPFLTTALAAAIGLERLTPWRLAGIMVGFAGILLIVATRPVGEASPLGLAMAACGTLSFAAGTVYYRAHLVAADPLLVNFLQSLSGGAALLVCVGLLVPLQAVQPAPALLGSLAYLTAVVSIGGMLLWFRLVRDAGPGVASSFHLLNPVFGVLLSWAAFGTPIRPSDWLGIGIVATGLLLVTQRAHPQPRGNRR